MENPYIIIWYPIRTWGSKTLSILALVRYNVVAQHRVKEGFLSCLKPIWQQDRNEKWNSWQMILSVDHFPVSEIPDWYIPERTLNLNYIRDRKLKQGYLMDLYICFYMWPYFLTVGYLKRTNHCLRQLNWKSNIHYTYPTETLIWIDSLNWKDYNIS